MLRVMLMKLSRVSAKSNVSTALIVIVGWLCSHVGV